MPRLHHGDGRSRVTDIPWPKALAPKTDAKARKGKAGALPRADALVLMQRHRVLGADRRLSG